MINKLFFRSLLRSLFHFHFHFHFLFIIFISFILNNILIGTLLYANSNNSNFTHNFTENIIQYNIDHRIRVPQEHYQSYYDKYQLIEQGSKKILSEEAFVKEAMYDHVIAQIVVPPRFLSFKLGNQQFKTILGHRVYLNLISSSMKFPMQYSQLFMGVVYYNDLFSDSLIKTYHQFMWFNNHYMDGNILMLNPNKPVAHDSFLFQNYITKKIRKIASQQLGFHLNLFVSGDDNLSQIQTFTYFSWKSNNLWIYDSLLKADIRSMFKVGMPAYKWRDGYQWLLYDLSLKISFPMGDINCHADSSQCVSLALFYEKKPELRSLLDTDNVSFRFGTRMLLNF